MQIGCGVYVHTVRGRPYLYFWHYETKGRSRVQVNEYVGPLPTARTRSEAMRRCDAYYAQAEEELNRLRSASHASIAGLR
jgi:hypothetical protein